MDFIEKTKVSNYNIPLDVLIDMNVLKMYGSNSNVYKNTALANNVFKYAEICINDDDIKNGMIEYHIENQNFDVLLKNLYPIKEELESDEQYSNPLEELKKAKDISRADQNVFIIALLDRSNCVKYFHILFAHEKIQKFIMSNMAIFKKIHSSKKYLENLLYDINTVKYMIKNNSFMNLFKSSEFNSISKENRKKYMDIISSNYNNETVERPYYSDNVMFDDNSGCFLVDYRNGEGYNDNGDFMAGEIWVTTVDNKEYNITASSEHDNMYVRKVEYRNVNALTPTNPSSTIKPSIRYVKVATGQTSYIEDLIKSGKVPANGADLLKIAKDRALLNLLRSSIDAMYDFNTRDLTIRKKFAEECILPKQEKGCDRAVSTQELITSPVLLMSLTEASGYNSVADNRGGGYFYKKVKETIIGGHTGVNFDYVRFNKDLYSFIDYFKYDNTYWGLMHSGFDSSYPQYVRDPKVYYK